MTVGRIRVGGMELDLDDPQAKRLIVAARSRREYALCMCRHKGHRAPRLIPVESGHVRRFPLDGSSHGYECRFKEFTPAELRSRGLTSTAIRSEEGKTLVSAAELFRVRDASHDASLPLQQRNQSQQTEASRLKSQVELQHLAELLDVRCSDLEIGRWQHRRLVHNAAADVLIRDLYNVPLSELVMSPTGGHLNSLSRNCAIAGQGVAKRCRVMALIAVSTEDIEVAAKEAAASLGDGQKLAVTVWQSAFADAIGRHPGYLERLRCGQPVTVLALGTPSGMFDNRRVKFTQSVVLAGG